MALTTEQQMLVEQRLSNEKKSIGVAYLLWFFFGALGIHRFYLGKTGTGFLMLALLILGTATLVIYVGILILAAVGIWLLIDAFLIPGMVETDARTKRTVIANEIGVASNGSAG